MAVSVGTLIGKLILDKTGWTKSTKSAIVDVGSFTKSTMTMMSRWAKRFAAVGVAAIGGIIAYTASYEKALLRTVSVAGGGMKELGDKAREMGRITIFSAKESATAMYNLASAGLSVKDTVGAIAPAMHLAAAAAATLDQSTAIMATTMRQFNLDAGDATRIADVFTYAIHKSRLTMSTLTEAMKFAGPMGASFKWSLEQTAAAVAEFADMGMHGTMAGTNLRMAMLHIISPSNRAQKAMAELGVEMYEVNAYSDDLLGTLKLFKDIEGPEQAAKIFGTRSGAVMYGLIQKMNAGTLKYTERLKAMENAAGRAAQSYGDMTQNVADKGKILFSALSEAVISIGETWQDDVKRILDESVELVNTFIDKIKDNKEELHNAFSYIAEPLIYAIGEFNKFTKNGGSSSGTSGSGWGVSGSVTVPGGVAPSANPLSPGTALGKYANKKIKATIDAIEKNVKAYIAIGSICFASMKASNEATTKETTATKNLEVAKVKAAEQITRKTKIDKETDARDAARKKKLIKGMWNKMQSDFMTTSESGKVSGMGIDLLNSVTFAGTNYQWNVGDLPAGEGTGYRGNLTKDFYKNGAFDWGNMEGIDPDDLKLIRNSVEGSDYGRYTADEELGMYGGYGKLTDAQKAEDAKLKNGWEKMADDAYKTFLKTTDKRLADEEKNLVKFKDLVGQAGEKFKGGIADAAMGLKVDFAAIAQNFGSSIIKQLMSKDGISIGPDGRSIGGSSTIFGQAAMAYGVFETIKAIGSDVVRMDERSKAEKYEEAIESTKSLAENANATVAKMLADVNAGNLTMTEEQIAKVMRMQEDLGSYGFEDPNVSFHSSRRGGLSGAAGGKQVAYYFTNQEAIDAQLEEFQNMYETLGESIDSIEGSADFEAKRSSPFTGSGTSIINNMNFNVGTLIADENAKKELAREVFDYLTSLGLVKSYA